jgi:hypothetical protein
MNIEMYEAIAIQRSAFGGCNERREHLRQRPRFRSRRDPA